MIKVYDKNNNLKKQTEIYWDARVEQEISISDSLLLNIPKKLGEYFEEEGYIECKEGRFVIKEKNLSDNSYGIVGKQDLEELLAWVESKAYVTEDIITIGEDLLEGTGWQLKYGDEWGRNLLRNSHVEKTSSREYVKYANLTDIFDEYGEGLYTFSFDLKSAIGGPVQAYQTDSTNIKYKYTPGVKIFNTTTEYKRYSITVDVSLNRPEDTNTSLSFYGTYDSGRIPSVKNVKVEKGSTPTPWTPAPEDLTLPKRTVTGSNMTILEFIHLTANTFGYEIKFNSQDKIIYLAEEIGVDKGVYFHDEVNLKSIQTTSDTYDFATRLIPVGFDGMTIELINNNKMYVENHSYSNKVVTQYWEDERYIDPESLKEDAEKRLAKICIPLRSYAVDVEDLSRNTDYEILSYEIGDTVTIVDKDTKLREKQRIIKKVKYLNEVGKDTATIANRMRFLGETQENIINDLKKSFNITKVQLEVFEDSIVARVSDVEAIATDVEQGLAEEVNNRHAQFLILADEITSTVERIENLRIGASNRLYQSQTHIPFDFNSGNGEVILIRDKLKPYYKVTSSQNIDLSASFPNSQFAEKLEEMGEVTISLDIMVDVDRAVTIDGKDFEIKANRWTRIWITKELTENTTNNTRVRLPFSRKITRDKIIGAKLIESLQTNINTIYYRDLQVEKGNLASDHTPTPEELEVNIERYSSEIKQLADSISLIATRNENTGRLEVTPDAIVQAINTTDGVGRLKTVKVTVDENGLIIDDGALLIRDETGQLIVTSKGLRMKYLFHSLGGVHQAMGGWGFCGTLEAYDGISNPDIPIFVYVPEELLIQSAILRTRSMPTYLTDDAYGAPEGYYHGRSLGLYTADASAISLNVSSFGGGTVPNFIGTDVTNQTWGGRWDPTGSEIQTREIDVSSLLQPGQRSVFLVKSDLPLTTVNTRYKCLLQLELELTGFLRG